MRKLSRLVLKLLENKGITGIEEIDMTPASVCKAQQNVYSLDGQLVHKGLSVEGLAKGIYIVNGKKVIIK